VAAYWVQLQQGVNRLPIFYRIAIGNTVIIVFGAVGGTLLTRHFLTQTTDLWLILAFILIGVSLSAGINFFIVSNALDPLKSLSNMVKDVQADKGIIDPGLFSNRDPDIYRLAFALGSLINQLEERSSQLRAISSQAIHAQEEERKRIARTLHDDIGQMLSVLIVSLERLEVQLPTGEIELKTRLAGIRELASNALLQLRTVIYDLRPVILDDLGLVPAIRWYARKHLEEAGVRAKVDAFMDDPSLTAQMNVTLFRIAQEAINNILRHAGAKSAEIRLQRRETCVCLEIQDDGYGFPISQVYENALRQQHLGLLGMRERAELMGGTLQVESQPGCGAYLKVCLPFFENGDGRNEQNSSSARR
jgi:two-component system sensor histidine kinase UhpB